jgi:glutamyl-tRNA reductase
VSILLVGLNHQTAPVEIREQLAFSREGAATALLMFRNQFPKSECSILSTCNRVELMVSSEDEKPGIADMIGFLAQARDLPVDQFRRCLYQFTGEQAVRHVYRVAAGLDSMVLGENQIVNQLKNAYTLASEQGTTGRVLNRVFHHAFNVSKRVRSETEIGQGKISVPSVAVKVAQQIFEDFANKQTLVIGAGEMAQLVCQYLRDANASRFVVTSRSLLNAKALADACQGQAVPFDQLDEQLVAADIVIAATACPVALLSVERLREIQKRRHGRLLFVIDLAVPRNVAPEAARLEQLYLYDIDALGRIAAQNQEHRLAQLEICERILDQEVSQFEQWLAQTKTAPLIARMFADARQLRDAELQRLLNHGDQWTEEQKRAVGRAMDSLIGKFMHPCIATLQRLMDTQPQTPAKNQDVAQESKND